MARLAQGHLPTAPVRERFAAQQVRRRLHGEPMAPASADAEGRPLRRMALAMQAQVRPVTMVRPLAQPDGLALAHAGRFVLQQQRAQPPARR